MLPRPEDCTSSLYQCGFGGQSRGEARHYFVMLNSGVCAEKLYTEFVFFLRGGYNFGSHTKFSRKDVDEELLHDSH